MFMKRLHRAQHLNFSHFNSRLKHSERSHQRQAYSALRAGDDCECDERIIFKKHCDR